MKFWILDIRSSTSTGANYRAACRVKSVADFLNKLRIVAEEADETSYWLEILEESHLIDSQRIEKLKLETNEITAIIGASQKTIHRKINSKN